MWNLAGPYAHKAGGLGPLAAKGFKTPYSLQGLRFRAQGAEDFLV